MIQCTVRGVGSHHALPKAELTKLKKFLFDIALPRLVDRRVQFEEVWKNCVKSIGQACKQYCIDQQQQQEQILVPTPSHNKSAINRLEELYHSVTSYYYEQRIKL